MTETEKQLSKSCSKTLHHLFEEFRETARARDREGKVVGMHYKDNYGLLFPIVERANQTFAYINNARTPSLTLKPLLVLHCALQKHIDGSNGLFDRIGKDLEPNEFVMDHVKAANKDLTEFYVSYLKHAFGIDRTVVIHCSLPSQTARPGLGPLESKSSKPDYTVCGNSDAAGIVAAR